MPKVLRTLYANEIYFWRASSIVASWHDEQHKSSHFWFFLVFLYSLLCFDAFLWFCRFSFVFGSVLVILLLIILLEIPYKFLSSMLQGRHKQWLYYTTLNIYSCKTTCYGSLIMFIKIPPDWRTFSCIQKMISQIFEHRLQSYHELF
jgi:hypothetical protein